MNSRNRPHTIGRPLHPPRHLFQEWPAIARQLHRAGNNVALFCDFDGTLAPIRRDPDTVVLAPRVRELLADIAKSGVTLGIVSGRTIADVRKRVGLRHIWYAGAHGFFICDPSNHSHTLANSRQKARMKDVMRFLARSIRGARGLRLERKVVTVALHYRGAPAKSREIGRRAIAAVMELHPGLSLLSGKKVWGILPDAQSDKWAAISFILRQQRKQHGGGPRSMIFVGDDATDERVFRQMHGISVAVGKKQKTAARYYLRSPAEVRQFLERFRTIRLRGTAE